MIDDTWQPEYLLTKLELDKEIYANQVAVLQNTYFRKNNVVQIA